MAEGSSKSVELTLVVKPAGEWTARKICGLIEESLGGIMQRLERDGCTLASIQYYYEEDNGHLMPFLRQVRETRPLKLIEAKPVRLTAKVISP